MFSPAARRVYGRAAPHGLGQQVLSRREPRPIVDTMRSGCRKALGRGKRKWRTQGVLLDESAADGPISLATVFGNARPVELEIGTGKGTFLLARATARPELNFLGIEQARAYCHYAADRVGRAGLKNVRLLRAEAAQVFNACLADSSLWRIHIYFPDPWPKRRHHRRRLIQPLLAQQLHRTLRPGGQLIIVTDHQEYFRQIRRVLLGVAGLATVPMPQRTDLDGELTGTNFERKYITQGRWFYHTTRMKYI